MATIEIELDRGGDEPISVEIEFLIEPADPGTGQFGPAIIIEDARVNGERITLTPAEEDQARDAIYADCARAKLEADEDRAIEAVEDFRFDGYL